MTREEKIIDKACKWLHNELCETKDRDGYPSVESKSFVTVDEFIDEFCKAM